jgi:hypothetical protein
MLQDPARTETALRARIEALEDENAHLRSRIAFLTGARDIRNAVRVFGFTPAEAAFFVFLVRWGEASHGALQDAIYSRDTLSMLHDTGVCLRSYAKRVRAKIRPHGLDFRTVYGLGWSMSDACRSCARSLMSAADGEALG